MQFRLGRQVALMIAVLIAVGVCFIDAGAQRRKRRSRRATTAVATPSPTPIPDDGSDPSDPRIISTADQPTAGTQTGRRPRPKPASTPAPETDAEVLRRTITDLSGQLNKLNDKLNQVEEQQRSLVDLERLSRAEQRAETFRVQLRDVQQKESDIQGQLDQIEYALQPENIDRAVGMIGTTHPEEVRDQRRRQLEAQRTKIKAQYDQLEQSRVRLEAAIASADQEVTALRTRIDAGNAEANQLPPVKTTILPPQTPGYSPPAPAPTPPPQEPPQ
jgi:hypothetical protein